MKTYLTFLIVSLNINGLFSDIQDNECVVSIYENIPNAIEGCTSIILDNLDVPPGQILRLPLRNGSKLTFRGNITFQYTEWTGPLAIINGTNVIIEGEEGSQLNGQGEYYWDGHGSSGSKKPKFFTMQLHNSTMRNIKVLNAPMHCVQLFDSTNVVLSDWVIDNLAGNGGKGKNTDGFDVRNSTDLVIRNSIVYNQDDCVALNSGSNILVEDLICYGSHGLSLSVGFSNDTFALNSLENVTIANSVLSGGQNAIHIKTHMDSGKGIIQNVTYRNIQFIDTEKYGISIQENYGGAKDSPPKNNIPIVNLTLENIIGHVESTAVPIFILCAEEGCFDWSFNNVFVIGSKSSNCSYTPENFSC